MESAALPPRAWPRWQRILFRCCFIFFILTAAPWDWLSDVPGADWLARDVDAANDWVVNMANRTFLHVRPELVPLNGSGDTSFGWAALWTYCCIALGGGIIWSAVDRKRESYVQLNYWLCILLRYFLALSSLSYGIAKLFLTQMTFPTTSELATPLGDFLPMRLAWMFIGYSATYQFFSGLAECLAGLLLLWRRTATLGSLLAAGIFLNVAVLNLSYDIPVKIFSLEMLAVSLFLLANEGKRLVCFFILDRPAPRCRIYHYPLRKRWMRIGRVILKCAFLVMAIGMTTAQVIELHNTYNQIGFEALRPGLYEVTAFSRSGQAKADTLSWTDIALDGKRSGSFKGGDTNFPQRYGRKYFAYDVDTAQHTFLLSRPSDDSLLVRLRYEQPDTTHIELSGTYGADSLQILLRRSPHRFQLSERPFHWLSERNR